METNNRPAALWLTGRPKTEGLYLTRLGFGEQETKQRSHWRVMLWDSERWVDEKTLAPLIRETVFRWLPLPEGEPWV